MPSSWIPAVGFTLLPSVGSAIVGIGTNNQIETWYATLRKPKWCPPDWLFPPVWASLYTAMGYGSYLVWKELGGFTKDAVVPLGVYSAQLALNWTWSQVFFGAHKIKLHGERWSSRAAATVFQTTAAAITGSPWIPFSTCQKPEAAFVHIVLLQGSVIATTLAWYPINRTAAYLMSPCIAWLTLATALSYRIWRNNPDKEK